MPINRPKSAGRESTPFSGTKMRHIFSCIFAAAREAATSSSDGREEDGGGGGGGGVGGCVERRRRACCEAARTSVRRISVVQSRIHATPRGSRTEILIFDATRIGTVVWCLFVGQAGIAQHGARRARIQMESLDRPKVLIGGVPFGEAAVTGASLPTTNPPPRPKIIIKPKRSPSRQPINPATAAAAMRRHQSSLLPAGPSHSSIVPPQIRGRSTLTRESDVGERATANISSLQAAQMKHAPLKICSSVSRRRRGARPSSAGPPAARSRRWPMVKLRR